MTKVKQTQPQVQRPAVSHTQRANVAPQQTNVAPQRTNVAPQQNTFSNAAHSTANRFQQMLGQRYSGDTAQRTTQGLGDTGTVLSQVGRFIPGLAGQGTQILGNVFSAGSSAANTGRNIGENRPLDALGQGLSTFGSLASVVPFPPAQIAGRTATAAGFAINNRTQLANTAKEMGQSISQMTAHDWAHGMPGLPE